MEKLLDIELLDPDKLIKVNDLKEVSDPAFFKKDNIPTDLGLLSNQIFGMSVYERSNVYAYVNLSQPFINPLIYKTLVALNGKIRDIVHGLGSFDISSDGDIIEVPEEDGHTGMDWFYKVYNKIKFKQSASEKRAENIKFIEKNRKYVWMDKLIITPPYYRDIDASDGGRVGIGNINKIYNNVLLSVRAIKDTADYGFSIADSIKGRLQDQIVGVYNWFTSGDDMTTGIVSESSGLAKKSGYINKSLRAKTADYGSRLIITSADVKYDSIDQMLVDLDYCGLPLSAAASELLPYMIFYIKRFFDNEFSSGKYPYKDKSGEVKYVTVKDPNIEFSDERIKEEINRYIKGYSNRFIPIEVPNEEGLKLFMKFKGRDAKFKDDESSNPGIINRRLIWVDLIYMAAVDSAKGKHTLLTRYPLEDYLGQCPFKINVLSTIKTEPIIIDGEVYEHYPYIREDMIGSNSSGLFIDSLQISNLVCEAYGADYRKNKFPLCNPPEKFNFSKQKPLELLETPKA